MGRLGAGDGMNYEETYDKDILTGQLILSCVFVVFWAAIVWSVI